MRGFDHHETFFPFLPKWDRFKKSYKFGQVVPTLHDFICRSRVKLTRLCHVSLKSCQVDTTFVTSTPEVMPTWHDFVHVIIKKIVYGSCLTVM